MLLAELNCLQLNCAMKTNTALKAAAIHLLVVPPTFTSASNTGGSAKNFLPLPTHLACFLSQFQSGASSFTFSLRPPKALQSIPTSYGYDSAVPPLDFKRSEV